MMTRRVALALGALAAYRVARADDLYDDIQGTWDVASAEREGRPAPDLLSHALVLDMGRRTFAIREGDETLASGAFRFAEGRPLHAVDFRHEGGRWAGKTWLGVLAWDLQKDELTICDNAADPGKPRPTSLATATGSGHVRLTFRRRKP